MLKNVLNSVLGGCLFLIMVMVFCIVAGTTIDFLMGIEFYNGIVYCHILFWLIVLSIFTLWNIKSCENNMVLIVFAWLGYLCSIPLMFNLADNMFRIIELTI